MIDEKHIAALEVWLKKTREEQNELIVQLRHFEDEAETLRTKIAALEEVAQQAESMIDNLLLQVRSTGSLAASAKARTRSSDTSEVPVGRPKPSPAESKSLDAPLTPRPNTVAYFGRPQVVRNMRSEPLTNRFVDRTITQACTLLLREAGQPLHVNELYNLLVAGGMEFKGNNPTISVAVSLNRNRRFRKVGPGTFDLMIREASQAAS